MKQSVSTGLLIGAVVAVLAVIGFFAFRMLTDNEGHGTMDPKMSQNYQNRASSGYGQTPAGMTRPTGGGGRPGGYGGYGGGGRPGGYGGGPGGYGGGQGGYGGGQGGYGGGR